MWTNIRLIGSWVCISPIIFITGFTLVAIPFILTK